MTLTNDLNVRVTAQFDKSYNVIFPSTSSTLSPILNSYWRNVWLKQEDEDFASTTLSSDDLLNSLDPNLWWSTEVCDRLEFAEIFDYSFAFYETAIGVLGSYISEKYRNTSPLFIKIP